MNINQIKYFVSVVEQGSFSLAARTQFVTVQAVSKSIGDLERELGIDLFVRANRGAIPTEAGMRFYKKAVIAVDAFKSLEAFSADAPADDSTFTLALCAPNFNNNAPMRFKIKEFLEHGTGLRIHLPLIDEQEVGEALTTRKTDALITVGAVKRPELDCVNLGTLPVGIAVAPSHPLARRSTIKLKELVDYPVVLSTSFSSFNESILDSFMKRGIAVRTHYAADLQEFNRHMDEQAAFTPYVVVPFYSVRQPESHALAIDHREAIGVPICLVSLKQSKVPAYHVVESFLAHVPTNLKL